MGTGQMEPQLRRLLTGLADQEIKQGHQFAYDSGFLHADDVAELALPSVLCIAQDLAERLGVGGFGYNFRFGPPNPVFPLHAEQSGRDVSVISVAPFVTEVFMGEVMDCRSDLALLFATAARIVDPEFDLASNTNYAVESAPAGASAAPNALER